MVRSNGATFLLVVNGYSIPQTAEKESNFSLGMSGKVRALRNLRIGFVVQP